MLEQARLQQGRSPTSLHLRFCWQQQVPQQLPAPQATCWRLMADTWAAHSPGECHRLGLQPSQMHWLRLLLCRNTCIEVSTKVCIPDTDI